MRTASINYSVNSLKHSNMLKSNGSKNNSAAKYDKTLYSKLPNTLNFLGTYYATTDSHSRMPIVASTLSEIENRIKNGNHRNEPVFLLDCGDFTGDSYSSKSIADTYILFKKRNPDTTCIFNLGNYDLNPLMGNFRGDLGSDNKTILKRMSDAGIEIISASYCEAMCKKKKAGEDIDVLDFIKPYIVVNDIVNGKVQTVLISGIGTRSKCGIEEEKDALDYLKGVMVKDGITADKTIFLLHDKTKNADELLRYAKEDLGFKNVELAIGGHPHSIHDYRHGDTRVLYPPAQGKGAYEIYNGRNGFEFEKLNLKPNGYDYSPLANNADVIDNSDINACYPVNNAYLKILNDPINSKYLNIITKNSPYNLEFRNYDEKISMPTSFGTFVANKYRDFLEADIGLVRNQFLREKLPSKGKPVNWYNICDSINVDADLYRADNVTAAKLKEIFEIAFKKQDMGLSNPFFLEYSDNIRITRRQLPDEKGNIISQIEIKEDDGWRKLLDDEGKPVNDSETFSLASEDALICGYFREFSELNLKNKQLADLTMRDVLIKALREEKPNSKEPNYHTSEILTV